jgi:hypothetical protein
MHGSGLESAELLDYFPDREMTTSGLRRLLRDGSLEERAWAVTHLLQFAAWEEIWTFVSRDEVRALFPMLTLPPNLRRAWARLLEISLD